MILRGLKNYGKSLKFYFTPLGVISIFFVIGISIFINTSVAAVKDLFTQVGQLIGETSIKINWKDVWWTIWGNIRELNWSDYMNAIKTMFSRDWLKGTLFESLSDVFGSLKEVADQVLELIQSCITKIIVALVVFLVFIVLGIISSFIITSLLVRSDLTKVQFWKILLASVIDLSVFITSIILASLLSKLWGPLGVIFLILSLFGAEVFSVVEAFWLHAKGKIALKELLKMKKIGAMVLADVIVSITGLLSFIIVMRIFNGFTALFLAVPLLVLIAVVINTSGDTYVLETIGYDPKVAKAARKEKHKAKKADKKEKKANKKADKKEKKASKKGEKEKAR